MLAIYKKELKTYFTSMTGYIFVAFIIFLVSVYFTAYNLTYGNPQISQALSSSSFVFLIVVPLLTMRIIAEERHQKTDQLLLTSPVKVTSIVMGKYLAIETIFLIPTLLFCFYPLILSNYGKVSFPMSYTGILGYFLLGSAFLAIGLFLSSVTESQVIAAVLCFGALLITYLMKGLTSFISSTAFASYLGFTIVLIIGCLLFYNQMKNAIVALGFGCIAEIALTIVYIVKKTVFEGLIANVLNVLSINDKYNNFVDGIFDITGVVYYITAVVIFIFLTVQSIQKRRWS